MKNYFKHNPSGKIYQYDDYTPRGDDYTKLPAKSGKTAYAAQCREEVQKYLQPWADKHGRRNPTVYCNITKVASSGMSRNIEFYAVFEGELMRITHLIAGAGDYPLTDSGLRIGGCGMDMRFAALECVGVPNNFDIRSI